MQQDQVWTCYKYMLEQYNESVHIACTFAFIVHCFIYLLYRFYLCTLCFFTHNFYAAYMALGLEIFSKHGDPNACSHVFTA